ncbi:ABC transporter ATP-binding protein [Ahrensia sp. R2A130]|uniref:ABC transporter ATP-binding protein n=1 Tax=Ahrensia sp. R2A130 TaxID=744979 RepID=UPI0001E0E107|nr:ABC transporter ATP-binding protein [Ahrensia sp. R2A130]EFL87542.1 spermidine/putrescine import ATP-binding protein PotA [Ahrensia sp. R2A130]
MTSPTGAVAPPAVEVRGLAKHYGAVVALTDVDVTIAAGEYFVLLGPSGGGKTTLLRTIGGFHRPTHGQVLLHGNDVGHLPPDKRPTAMVFQSYALFPHMNVLNNVGYGLKIAGLGKDERREKSAAALTMVGLDGYADRKPHELSGGQQQRVQLARAMVLERDILLLDEPLAALDAQLRKDMCLELKHLQHELGMTFIHVTHNQEEAMTVADRIALIADGELVEVGPAKEVYRAPRRRFTASFVGENNIFEGTVTNVEGAVVSVDVAGTNVAVDPDGQDVAVGAAVSLSIRSELVKLTTRGADIATDPGASLPATYKEAVYLGLTTSHLADIDGGGEVVSRVVEDLDEDVAQGTPVLAYWNREDLRLHTS